MCLGLLTWFVAPPWPPRSLWPLSAASLYLVSEVNSQWSALLLKPLNQIQTATPPPPPPPPRLAALWFLLLCVKKVTRFKQVNTTLSPWETPKSFQHLNVWHIIEKVSPTHKHYKPLTLAVFPAPSQAAVFTHTDGTFSFYLGDKRQMSLPTLTQTMKWHRATFV